LAFLSRRRQPKANSQKPKASLACRNFDYSRVYLSSKVRIMGAMRLLARALLLLLPLSLSAGEPDAWWNQGWWARRPIDIRFTGAGVQGAETGCVELRGMGQLSANGQDLRIVADGQPVPLKIVFLGQEDRCVVAFRMPREAKRYFVYFGNAKAPKLTVPWEPERGLWLETRRYNGGDCQNWDQMKQLVARSGPPHGAGPVRQVFHGWDPFSSTDKYVSLYKGFLNCTEAGEYIFCTSSDDASFVFVDDKLVVQEPGWHGAEGQAKRTAKVQLVGGVHKFEYVHVNGGGSGIAAAYWQPPSAKRIDPIPPNAFTPVALGRPGLLELMAGTPVDVEGALLGEAYVEERPLLRYRFRLLEPAGPGEPVWEFGDGQTAAGREVEHLFFHEGLFNVVCKVQVKGKEAKAASLFAVHIDYERQAEFQKGDPRKFLELAKTYDWDKMPTPSLEAAASFYFLLEDKDGQLATAGALSARPQVSDALYFEQVMRLQALLRDYKKEPNEALKLLAAAENRLKNDKNLRAKILREVGDVYYFYKNDLDRALLEYDKVVGRYFGLEDNIVRVTKIRIGDIMRERGNYDKAAANYAEAERLRLDKWSPTQIPMRQGALVLATEDFLRRGDAVEARKWVEIWEWEFPLERLRGQSTVLRARIALLEKNKFEAQKQLEALVRVNPESQYIGEALYMLAELALGAKENGKAKGLLKEIVDKHPESEMVPKAEELLQKMEKDAQAAAKAADADTQAPPKKPEPDDTPKKAHRKAEKNK
jgi:tetratricopeptide (TPR) repeat protein